ncbi:bifunctional phosphopantothenoylcysteine decarboxylase/phosphopantothenate--cysteine ligase CoaBC [Mechercharimyces sp. CAU 1602]|uniref:bifunctional phosphopantothenoylcysteine decarboxylase/phosphopantothenate--cysteine ligase CoaBC n=1 Tax=Mechercharimyces sp. CAU 1602 TaxID=2973933 RepID=UPI0021631101|nr:bifunctional phosphopantothenoylcysteine decarboxylase/phosphopantothenate--cysteine ligase CoaBC [Mechercharimyces sp. CAU 1602]MCS1351399.1 bifunctional phosphopantothenoylcysteine decarboxylase/phosphopantothenate--cysteine ligase CoaBC [Mechercharimyces sp. CAU 1602]
MKMQGKKIVVGVTGGIAAFKSASLVSKLAQAGAEVRVIMSRGATQFVTPLTFQALSHHEVFTDIFEERNPDGVAHIDLADEADLIVVAPATAHLLAKIANGMADDMLSATLLATRAPILLAPAMNGKMYTHPAVEENRKKVLSMGVHLVEPEEGQLACGYVGKGRMAEPEEIFARVESFFQRPLLQGKRVLITAGPTREPVDPVRYFTNYSSGKMGYALAQAARQAGAEVLLVSGPTSLTTPDGVLRIDVGSAAEMKEAVLREIPQVDIVIKAAAVADYRPIEVHDHKLKKKSDELIIRMERTEDIAQLIGEQKKKPFFVGFAAETDDVAHYALGKLERKNMDLIVANPVNVPDSGFESDYNTVTIYDRGGEVAAFPKMEKERLAHSLIELIGERLL